MGRLRGHADANFPLVRLGAFRTELHACFTRRADALFELGDALLCAGRSPSLPHLSLEPVHRRGWGSTYAALAGGRIDAERLRDLLASSLPPADPLVYAVDVSTWPRCDAEASPSAATTTIRRATRPASRSSPAGPTSGWPSSASPATAGPPRWTCAGAPDGRHRPDRRRADPRAARPPARRRARAAVRVRRRLRLRPAHLDLAEERVAVLVRLRADRCFYADPPPAARSPRAAGRAATAPSSPAPTRRPGRPRPPTLATADDQYGTVTVARLGRPASQAAAPPRPRHRRAAADRARHRRPGRGRARPGPHPPAEGALAVVGRPRRAGPGSALAGLRPPLRPGAHLPLLQADPRLDHPARRATPSRPTAGPGWCCWPTPSCAWPARSSRTAGCPGSGPDRRRRLSPLSGAPRVSAASGARWARRRPRQNPAGARRPAQGQPLGPATRYPAIKKPSKKPPPRPRRRLTRSDQPARPPMRPAANPARPRVKSQAKASRDHSRNQSERLGLPAAGDLQPPAVATEGRAPTGSHESNTKQRFAISKPRADPARQGCAQTTSGGRQREGP